ncbi:protein kinase family protein [Streptomyces cacaoi]|uniref:hypothetical protein n=1 Tax=Streptomyces cacaoi TaxID=1898 RepID=UPI003749207B
MRKRAAGHVPPDVMPCTDEGNRLHAATAAERARLEEGTLDVLTRLHGQATVEQADFLAVPGPGGTPLRRHVAARRAYCTWVVSGRPGSPVIERGFDRSAANWPEDGAKRCCAGATYASATSSSTVSRRRPSRRPPAALTHRGRP